MKLLYLENTLWEYDFIKNEILKNISDLEVEMFKKDQFPSFLERDDVINNNIIVINIVCSIDDKFINIINHIRPIAIFYLSDERGNNTNTTILEKYAKVVFRQYNFSHYTYGANNFQIPLGYAKNYLDGEKSLTSPIKNVEERKYNCSFIGAMKSDRMRMSTVFKVNMEKTNIEFVKNTWRIGRLPYPPEKCFEVYNDSIFVICGRGNCNLDCFRIYEAIVAGAIPILIGTLDEINTTFHYNNRGIPPFIYDDSWEKVVIKCNTLLQDPAKLQKIQDELLEWWKTQLATIHAKLGTYLQH
jgi:hypothetical protein